MSVPNTNTFSLDDVRVELGLAYPTSLSQCFANAIEGRFDPNYVGEKDRLSNFRNYGEYYMHILEMGVENYSGEDVFYRVLDAENDLMPGSNHNGFHANIINNHQCQVENTTLQIVGRTDDTVQMDYGAANCTWRMADEDHPIPLVIENIDCDSDGKHFWLMGGLLTMEPGQYRLHLLTNPYITSEYPDYRGQHHYRNITLKRYIEFDSYSTVLDAGAQSFTFHHWFGEDVQEYHDSGLTVNMINDTGGNVDVDVHNNGDVEEVLTLTIETVASTLRESKTHTVYHRGAPEDYLECTDITPNTVLGDSDNTHYYVVHNNSSLMSYSGTLFWQILQGDDEASASYIAGGSNAITDLPQGNDENVQVDWHCNTADGQYVYFYARFNLHDDFQLIETMMVAT